MMALHRQRFLTPLHTQKMLVTLILAAAYSTISIPAHAQTQPGNTLLQFDFNGANPWPQAAADVMPSTPLDIATTLEVKAVGTPDTSTPDTSTPKHQNIHTGALVLGAQVGEVNLEWTATFTSGLFPVKNLESDLKRLKLGLTLSASAKSPVKMQIESFNAKKRRSGGLEIVMTPNALESYKRFDFDLASFKPVGTGKFSPTDPFVQFSFIIGAPEWKEQALHQITIDDFTYVNSEPVAGAK